MSGALTIEDSQTWIFAGWAFDMLLDRMVELLTDEDDKKEVITCKYSHGLELDWFEEPRRHRIAQALASAADQLSGELLVSGTEPRDLEFREALADIEGKLRLLIPDLGPSQLRP